METLNNNIKTIQLVTINEIEMVMDIYKNAIQYMLSNNIDQWDEVYPSEKELIKDINNSQLHGYYIDTQLLGVVALNNKQAPEYKNANWKLADKLPLVVHRLCVNPENKNKGVATVLMNFTKNWAKKNGYKSIRLDAFTKNPEAVRLYERLGYKNAGIIKLRKGEFYCFEMIL